MFDGDLGAALIRVAETSVDRPALWAAGQRLTYGELFDMAAGMAAALSAAGVGAGDRVALLSRRTPTVYAGVIASLLAGCTYVPLNPRFTRERNQSMLQASGAAALVLDEACASKLDSLLDPLDPRLVVVRPDSVEGAPAVGGRPAELVNGEGPGFWRSNQRPADPEQPAYLLFTSGTTGTPKGVPISHRNLAAYLRGLSAVSPIHNDDRMLQFVELTFDLSVHDMFLAWLNGAELYSIPDELGRFAPRFIAQHRVTACLVVPANISVSLEQGLVRPASMPSLRLSFFCGEALPRSVAAGWQEAAPNSRVINLYGPTEATIAFSYYEYDPEEASEFPVLPIGRPLGTEKMALFKPGMTAAGPGEYGEICLAGDQVTAGYWRNPEMDRQKFATVEGTRWYKTGDLGRWIEPFGFVFAGRADRQVKIRGYLVELQEIEGVLRRVTGRQQVAVIAWPITADGSADGSVAFVCGEETDTKDLRAHCRAVAGDYMTPNRVIFVPELPVNSNGKVDYKVLAQHPALESGEPAGHKAHQAR